jgi:hypothetical protein
MNLNLDKYYILEPYCVCKIYLFYSLTTVGSMDTSNTFIVSQLPHTRENTPSKCKEHRQGENAIIDLEDKTHIIQQYSTRPGISPNRHVCRRDTFTHNWFI